MNQKDDSLVRCELPYLGMSGLQFLNLKFQLKQEQSFNISLESRSTGINLALEYTVLLVLMISTSTPVKEKTFEIPLVPCLVQ